MKLADFSPWLPGAQHSLCFVGEYEEMHPFPSAEERCRGDLAPDWGRTGVLCSRKSAINGPEGNNAQRPWCLVFYRTNDQHTRTPSSQSYLLKAHGYHSLRESVNPTASVLDGSAGNYCCHTCSLNHHSTLVSEAKTRGKTCTSSEDRDHCGCFLHARPLCFNHP